MVVWLKARRIRNGHSPSALGWSILDARCPIHPRTPKSNTKCRRMPADALRAPRPPVTSEWPMADHAPPFPFRPSATNRCRRRVQGARRKIVMLCVPPLLSSSRPSAQRISAFCHSDRGPGRPQWRDQWETGDAPLPTLPTDFSTRSRCSLGRNDRMAECP
jgi:hypothetical protein